MLMDRPESFDEDFSLSVEDLPLSVQFNYKVMMGEFKNCSPEMKDKLYSMQVLLYLHYRQTTAKLLGTKAAGEFSKNEV